MAFSSHALAMAILFAAGISSPSRLPSLPTQLLVDPGDANRVYATTATGLYRSADGGRTWSFGASPEGLVDLAIAPSEPNVLYAFASGDLVRSLDHGDSWSTVSPPPDGVFGPLAVDPRDPDTIYAPSHPAALTFSAGLSVSSDGGHSWQVTLGDGPHAPMPLTPVGSSQSGTVLTAFPVPRGPVYTTSDGGQTWMSHALPFLSTDDLPEAIAADSAPGSPAFYVIGERVYGSPDSGTSWTASGTRPPAAVVHSLAAREGVLFATSDAGLFRSEDLGVTWQNVLPSPAAVVAVAPSDGNVVLAVAGYDLWRSGDGGKTFSVIGGDPPRETPIRVSPRRRPPAPLGVRIVP